jgi:transcriptional regulator with XRE-family HTH domain
MEKSIYTKQLNQVLSLLKELRLKSGYTQNDLAKLLDKPQSFVSKYESGERRLDIIELRTICKALRITFSNFINRLEGILDDTK